MKSEEEIKACMFGVELLSDELVSSVEVAHNA